jgi:hypothetical protein
VHWEVKRAKELARGKSGRGRRTTLTVRQPLRKPSSTGIVPRSMPSTAARRRPPTKQLDAVGQPLGSAAIDIPQTWPIARARRSARNRPFWGLHSLPSAKSRQSSARHDFQRKSREPSFESKLGGVGPAVAGALDRPRRLILTAAAASDGGIKSCRENRDDVPKIAT